MRIGVFTEESTGHQLHMAPETQMYETSPQPLCILITLSQEDKAEQR